MTWSTCVCAAIRRGTPMSSVPSSHTHATLRSCGGTKCSVKCRGIRRRGSPKTTTNTSVFSRSRGHGGKRPWFGPQVALGGHHPTPAHPARHFVFPMHAKCSSKCSTELLDAALQRSQSRPSQLAPDRRERFRVTDGGKASHCSCWVTDFAVAQRRIAYVWSDQRAWTSTGASIAILLTRGASLDETPYQL
jgi:hypothetical protein